MKDILDNLPPTEIDRLQCEVLNRAPEAALPCNLSDKWLDLITRDLQKFFDPMQIGTTEYAAGPIALILHILMGKNAGEANYISHDDLYLYFREYQIELALEEVSRRTHIKTEPANLATIFTNRRVEVMNKNTDFS